MVECNPWFPEEGSFDLEIWHWPIENVEHAPGHREKYTIIWPLWARIEAMIFRVHKVILALLILSNRQNTWLHEYELDDDTL